MGVLVCTRWANFKNETIQAALLRIADKELELGTLIASGELKLIFHGTCEHMYEDCFAGDIGISTHYVVLAHQVEVPADFALLIAYEQHSKLKWRPIMDALASNLVHQYTKNYL